MKTYRVEFEYTLSKNWVDIKEKVDTLTRANNKIAAFCHIRNMIEHYNIDCTLTLPNFDSAIVTELSNKGVQEYFENIYNEIDDI